MKPARSSREVSGIERRDGLVEAPMRTSRQSPNTNRVLVQTEVVDRRPPIISLLLDHSIGRLRVADWANNFLARRCHHSGRDRPFLTLGSKKTRTRQIYQASFPIITLYGANFKGKLSCGMISRPSYVTVPGLSPVQSKEG